MQQDNVIAAKLVVWLPFFFLEWLKSDVAIQDLSFISIFYYFFSRTRSNALASCCDCDRAVG